MAFDQPTRNRLARFVGEARTLLTAEFTRQIQNEYGLDPARGEVAPMETLRHLDNVRRATAQLLRQTLEHYLAASPNQGKKATQEALDRIVREQAFTVLNRLCALRMAEARGLLIESIARGFQSRGFQLYARLAGSALGETGDAYRAYLFSLFDEFAVDLAVLFDRFSPQGRLFPRESVLLDLLDAINHADLEPLWTEDETIGWIYQYFNSQEERRQMRAASQAPRNSRELAVRNQFFTPRYVVEFLTDNTLGRIWYEMMRGQTRLVDQCRYLVRRPVEIFLGHPNFSHDRAAEWVQAALAGDFSQMPEQPSEHDLSDFSLLIDGYELPKLCGYNGMDDFVDWADRQREEFTKTGSWKASTLELWLILFRMQRFWGHVGGPLSDEFVNGFMHEWYGAYSALRHALQNPPDDLSQEELLRQPVFIPRREVKDPRILKMLDPACGSMHFGLYAFDLFETIYEEAWERGMINPREFGDGDEAYTKFCRAIPRMIIENNIHGIDIDPRAVQIAGLSLWLRAQRAWHEQGVRAADRPVITRSNIVCAEPMPGDKEQLEEFASSLEPKLLGTLVKTIFEKMQLAGEAGSLLKIEEEIRSAVEEAQKRYQDYLLQEKKATGYLPGLAPERNATLLDLMELPDPKQFWNTAEELVVKALEEYASQAQNGQSYARRLFAQDAARGFAFIDLCRKRFDVVLMNPPFGLAPSAAFEYARRTYPNSYTEMLATFVDRGHSLSIGRVGAITSRAFMVASRLREWRESIVAPRLCLVADIGESVMDGAFVEAAAYVLENKYGASLLAFDCRGTNSVDNILESVTNSFEPATKVFIIDPSIFSFFPNNRIIYSITPRIAQLLKSGERFEPTAGTARQGLATWDDFRFVRLFWEPPSARIGMDKGWEFLSKGGAYSRYQCNVHLLMNWSKNGLESRAINIAKNGSDAQARQASDYWRRPGLTYSIRSQKGFSARILPKGCLFTGQGPLIVSESDISNYYLLGWVNSSLITTLIELQSNDGKFMSGLIKSLPWIEPSNNSTSLETKTGKVVRDLLFREIYNEVSPYFSCLSRKKTLLETYELLLESDRAIRRSLFSMDEAWNRFVSSVYKVDDVTIAALRTQLTFVENSTTNEDEDASESEIVADAIGRHLFSYTFGCIVGRWDIRYTTGERQPPPLPDPFDPLPVCPPGMLQNEAGLLATPADVPSDYPLRISWPGILVDDPGHPEDIEGRVREALQVIWGERAEAIEQEACAVLGVRSLRDYLSGPNNFFADHLSRYSKSRRAAPIYWPLSTASGLYTLWLYYHRLTDQTLYQAVNDFVDPKRKMVDEQLTVLQRKAGRSRDDERELERLATLAQELADFRAELLRVAAFWKPNLNDGVQITAAPLYRLFNHRQWRKRLQETWEKLDAGDYDWAHLAYSIWPDRVAEKCRSDKSLAIAHDLEHLYVEPPASKKPKRGKGKAQQDDDAQVEMELDVED